MTLNLRAAVFPKVEGFSHREIYVRPASKAHKRWPMLLKQVYEVDPLQCDRPEGRNVLSSMDAAGRTPECGGEMKIISFIRDTQVIFRILDHLDMLAEPEGEPNRGPPEESSITYQPIADDLRWELKRPSALGAPEAMINFTSVETQGRVAGKIGRRMEILVGMWVI